MPYHKHCATATGQKQFLRTNPDKQILVRFWGTSRFVSLTMFHSTDDGVTYENRSAIVQVQEAARNACMGNHSLLFFPELPKQSLRRQFRN